jgi:hypothetical protein
MTAKEYQRRDDFARVSETVKQAEQAAKKAVLKLHKTTRAANTAALVVYFSFFFPLGPRGLDSGRIFQPLAK